MERTIITHDEETAIAVVRFEHNGVTVEETFNLDMVIPGAKKVFEDFGLAFDKAAQLRALDQLTTRIQTMIENGAIQNRPTPPTSSPSKL
jgi:hypothetical protein